MGRRNKNTVEKQPKVSINILSQKNHPNSKGFMNFERRCIEASKYHDKIERMQYQLDMQSTYTF